MAPKRRDEINKQQRERAGTIDGIPDGHLEELRERFARFRQENRPRMRIPECLRDAALEAIQSGTPEVEVIRACRISRELLDRRREVKRGIARRVKPQASKARVFPVIEDKVSGPGSAVRGEEEASHLQLRVGRWEICIRQND